MLLFALLTYGVAFLLADARIFGCDAKLWNSGGNPEEDCRDVGIIKLRQKLLKHSFFSDLLGCYFCTGCWAGPIAHWLLSFGLTERYVFYTVDSVIPAVIMTLLVIPLGGTVAFILDVAVSKLEQ